MRKFGHMRVVKNQREKPFQLPSTNLV